MQKMTARRSNIGRQTPSREGSLTAVDLFSGCGGLSSGLKQAGFRVLAAVEKDTDAAKSYASNHPDVKLYEMDIRALTPARVLRDLGLKRGELDLVAGCPPCQGFTRLTEKRRRRDPRNLLIREFLRLVLALRPRACMLENVPGLPRKGRRLFGELRRGLEAAGYRIKYDVLELADYGVPQFRKRLVLFAGLKQEIPLPKQTHWDPEIAGSRACWRTVRDAIGFLKKPPTKSVVLARCKKPKYALHFARNIAPEVKKRLEYARENGRSRRSLPASLVLDCHRRRPDGYSDVYGVMKWDAPSPTMTSGCTNASKGRFGHPRQPRPLTPREAALLQTFPLDYKFHGENLDDIATQIGNALPRRFAKVAARTIAASLAAEAE
ncbi:MAG TPA: DNA cytosine methyltransferase [Polyangiaceae bacterium]|nr:DNA cytosine methyltransferase [Polyangiaceae bacterium]